MHQPVDRHVVTSGLRSASILRQRGSGWQVTRNLGLASSTLLHTALLVTLGLLLLPLHIDDGGPLQIALNSRAEQPVPGLARLEVPQVSLGDRDSFPWESIAMEAVDWEPPFPGSQGGDGSGTGRGAGPRGEFFGTVAYGNRIVYVLDVSTSMKAMRDPRTKTTRLQCAMDELIYSVEKLAPDQWFYVVLFCYETRQMFDENSVLPQMVRATPENKARLKDWLYEIRPGPGTDPRVSLRLALRMQPSAVFLLSDGEFNGRKRGPNRSILPGNPSVPDVVARTSDNQISIHTLAYEDPVNNRRMQALAAQTQGIYRFIEPINSQIIAAHQRAEKKNQTSNRRSEASARSELRRAQAFETRQPTSAMKRYRRIIDRFPDTTAAKTAQNRLDALNTHSLLPDAQSRAPAQR